MKAAPTLDGRLRIDLEDERDRMVLEAIVVDAQTDGGGLADALACMQDPDDEDWEEFVKPELTDLFDSQLAVVVHAVDEAGVPGPVFVVKEDAEAWYGALNRARLALEDACDLSTLDEESLDDKPSEIRSAFHRSRFYMTIQGLLLEFVMSSDS